MLKVIVRVILICVILHMIIGLGLEIMGYKLVIGDSVINLPIIGLVYGLVCAILILIVNKYLN